MVSHRYFCVFYKLDNCAVCTNSEAHNNDYDKDNVLLDCNNIHKHVEKSDMEVEVKETINENNLYVGGGPQPQVTKSVCHFNRVGHNKAC